MLQSGQPGRRGLYKGSKTDVVQSGLASYLPVKKDARAHGAQATMGCKAEKLELKTGSFSPGWLIAPQTAAWLRGWEAGPEPRGNLSASAPSTRCAAPRGCGRLLRGCSRLRRAGCKEHQSHTEASGRQMELGKLRGGKQTRREVWGCTTPMRACGRGTDLSSAAASRWCSARARERNI